MDFKLPDIGEGVAEGEIVKWHVAEGERVKEDQLMVEVMTDKATVQITAPTSGVIRKIRYKEGEVAKVHSVMVEIAEEGAKVAEAEEPEKKKPAKKEPEKEVSQKLLPPTAAVEPAQMTKPEVRVGHLGKVLATPATRKLAREKKIDIATVIGSGSAGRVTKEDVLAALSGGRVAGPGKVTGQQPAFAPAHEISERPAVEIVRSVPKPGPNGESREPLRGIRKKIAEHMRQSKDRAAHFSYVDEVDMTEIVELREETKKEAAAQGVKLSFLPFIIKATVAALKEYPMLNAMLDEEKGEIVYKYYYNMGVAMATDKGLVVPVIKEADKKKIIQIARETVELSDKARAGKLSLEELQGGTFTITSIGSIGGLFATPIINYPEVAILGINKIQERPVVRGGQIVARHMTYLSLTLDHRVVDGSEAAYFMNRLIGYLSDPKRMLLL